MDMGHMCVHSQLKPADTRFCQNGSLYKYHPHFMTNNVSASRQQNFHDYDEAQMKYFLCSKHIHSSHSYPNITSPPAMLILQETSCPRGGTLSLIDCQNLESGIYI